MIGSLYEIGLNGAQIEDKIPLSPLEKERMFVDILPDMPEDDNIAFLSFFVEMLADGSLQLADQVTDEATVCALIRQELDELKEFMDIGEGSIQVEQTEDIDWINNWKQYFHQFHIGDILVIPSWEELDPEDQNALVLHIDPGTAFGTGMHETTQLCIQALRKYVTPGMTMLDVGTGSGILGILSLMFGADHVVGTDLDICAEEAVSDNCRANGILPAQFTLLIGNLITDKKMRDEVGYERFDVVTANILADVLTLLTPVVVRHLKKGGVYITSGIIDDKEEEVKAAVLGAGLTIKEVTYKGEWVSITACKE